MVQRFEDGKCRCAWVSQDPLYIDYHDNEWGRPTHDERTLFEKLNLEAFQSGLSWITILKKRENFRAAFDNFDAAKVAAYTQDDVDRLMQDAGIVRNLKKVEATINNAQALCAMWDKGESLSDFLWGFVDGEPIINHWKAYTDAPASTDLSKEISKQLKKKGFKFVGPTTAYAMCQAMGLVNDHTVGCWRREDID